MTEEQEERVAAQSGSFRVGGDLEVNRWASAPCG
jgi:hypothetical protein